MSDYPTTIDLTRADARAVRIKGADLRPTDRVFDTYGNSYALARVKRGRYSTKFKREDLTYHETIGNDEDITVLRTGAP